MRFVIVNGVGTVVDIGLVFVLTHVLSAPILAAVFCGWLSSMLCGFFLNRRFVFSDGRASLFTASGRYLTLVALNLAVGVGAVSWLVSDGWNYVLTRLLSSTVLVITNFAIARWWIFGVDTRRGHPPATEVMLRYLNEPATGPLEPAPADPREH